MLCLASLSAEEKAVDTLGAELAGMARLPTQPERTKALRNLLRRWAAVDLDTARVTVEGWPDAAARPGLLGDIAWYWGETDVRSALEWAKSLPEGQRDQAVLCAIRRFRYADAREARAEVLRLPPGRLRDSVALRLVEDLNRGREAADWCATYPDAAASRTLVRAVIKSWIETADIQDADLNAECELIEGWASELPDARLRDLALAGALEGFVRLLYYPKPQRQPEPMRRLLRGIADPALRAELAAAADTAWRKAFPDNAGNPTAGGR